MVVGNLLDWRVFRWVSPCFGSSLFTDLLSLFPPAMRINPEREQCYEISLKSIRAEYRQTTHVSGHVRGRDQGVVQGEYNQKSLSKTSWVTSDVCSPMDSSKTRWFFHVKFFRGLAKRHVASAGRCSLVHRGLWDEAIGTVIEFEFS